jgi:FeS assembly SUF system regulator
MSMLRMTKQADYGIVLMTHLALQPGRSFAAPELAEETHIPLPTVSKILKLLAREGLLASHRGVKGGYSLERDPHEVSVAELIAALDGPISFTECIEDSPGLCSQEAFCRLRTNWQLINRVVRDALGGITLAHLTLPMSPRLVQLGSGGQGAVAH